MPVRVFSVQEREALRVKMLDAGFALIKEYGMTHASVEKITQAAGLGKSTFYRFFDCKERFVIEIMNYQRDRMRVYFDELLDGREKLSVSQAKGYFRKIVFSADSIYPYLTDEDERKLVAYSKKIGWYVKHEDATKSTMDILLSHMEGIRPDADYRLATNLIRVMAFAQIHQDELYKDVMAQTLDCLCTQLFACLFEE